MLSLSSDRLSYLQRKADWVWEQTLLIHKRAPDTRLASSVSPIEVFVCLYYGGVLKYDPKNPLWEGRDRLIVSKGHGSVSLYPILADVGFFPMEELERVCQYGSFLGAIPDPVIPGYETVNGSLGHGLGVACGMALALRRRRSQSLIFVMVGDGELHEGAVWEAIMFAGHHKLHNLALIVDNNTRCMLNFSKQVLDIFPLNGKFTEFGWSAAEVDGHDLEAVLAQLQAMRENRTGKPCVLISNTIKGHGIPSMERDPMCHVKSLSAEEVDSLIKGKTCRPRFIE